MQLVHSLLADAAYAGVVVLVVDLETMISLSD